MIRNNELEGSGRGIFYFPNTEQAGVVLTCIPRYLVRISVVVRGFFFPSVSLSRRIPARYHWVTVPLTIIRLKITSVDAITEEYHEKSQWR